jgi:DNA processing protein
LGSPEAALAAAPATLSKLVKADLVSAIHRGIPEDQLDATFKWLTEPTNHLITLADSEYPQSLLNISDPPILLYAKGRIGLLNNPTLAVVGSRHATPQGLKHSETFSATLGNSGLTIVSGLAHGVDAAAHLGGLSSAASSIAVVGTGLDKVYPAANLDLAHRLAKEGVIISEFPLGTPPLARNFPRRNRLISGLSLGCLVVEASLQSGSLITARLALEQGKDVFAIPGSIHSPQSKGCHALIKQGAKLVEASQDILDELEGTWITGSTNFEPNEFNSEIFQFLGDDPVDVETLSIRSGLTVGELSAMLLTLELGGQVSSLPGGLYQRLH